MSIGAYPSRALVTVEGRLAAMLAGREAAHDLLDPAYLPRATTRAREALASVGVTVAGPPGVRRADLGAELWFRDARDGLAFLLACERALHLPRLAQRVYRATGEARIESILWQTPRGNKTRVRLYDAGLRHDTHAPGVRLRLEVEQRWDGDRTPTPEQLAVSDLSRVFSARIRPWITQPNTIRVATPSDAIRAIYESVWRGERTLRSANSLGAKVNALAHFGDGMTPHDRRRRARELRNAGFALDQSGDGRSLMLDLREPLADLAASFKAQSRLWGAAA